MITAPAFWQGRFSFGSSAMIAYMPTKERVAIYIDGSNFYHYLKDAEISFPKGRRFDFKVCTDFLIGDKECVSKRYYTGVFRNIDNSSKSKELVSGQQKFLSEIEKDGFIIKRGKIMYGSRKTREKGTDVKIAVDLIIGAIDNLYDTAILVSSDTDLIPALRYMRYKKNLNMSDFPTRLRSESRNTPIFHDCSSPQTLKSLQATDHALHSPLKNSYGDGDGCRH